MTTKLTNCKRDLIVKTTIQQLFKKRNEKLREDENQIGLFLYNLCYPPEIQAHMGHLPDHFFVSKSEIYALYSGVKHQFNLQSSRKICALASHGWKEPMYEIGIGSVLSRRIDQFLEDKEKIQNDRDELISKLREMLNRITTVKRLQAEWPQGLKFYKKIIEEPLPNPPAVQSSDVNKLISQLEVEV